MSIVLTALLSFVDPGKLPHYVPYADTTVNPGTIFVMSPEAVRREIDRRQVKAREERRAKIVETINSLLVSGDDKIWEGSVATQERVDAPRVPFSPLRPTYLREDKDEVLRAVLDEYRAAGWDVTFVRSPSALFKDVTVNEYVFTAKERKL